jgi:hypothetical protein
MEIAVQYCNMFIYSQEPIALKFTMSTVETNEQMLQSCSCEVNFKLI